MAAGELSTEQMEIINLPLDARALVTAAAGTGKTHTLAGRLTRLIERDGLDAGDDILVLSFSRAAVAELRRRIGALSSDARYVGVLTFDSFATRVLAAADPAGSWRHLDYEGRIRSAVDLLSTDRSSDELGIVRHVLVDEIQDLVGSQAQLVMALLRRAAAGFTLFGDPAQAIYAHQATQEPGVGTKGSDFYGWIRCHFADNLLTLQLTHDYRATTPQTRAIADIGVQLRQPEPHHATVSHELRTVLLNLPAVGLMAARRMLVRENTEISALLTRTNGEALLMSRALFDAGIRHSYQRPGQEKAAPAWLGALTAGMSETRATRATLGARLEQIAAATLVSPDELYGLLRRLGPGTGREIDLRRIADRVREGNLPEDLNEVPPSRVIVSTIHRAKGLEFDRVLLTDWDGDPEDQGEANRILYVALSRARREIFHVHRPDTSGLKLDQATRRWIRCGFGPARWNVCEFQVTGRDTHSVHPAGAWLLQMDVSATQEYLKSAVRPGDPVILELLDQQLGADHAAHYGIYHAGHAVGLSSEEFGQKLGHFLGTRRRSAWPQQIDGLHVEFVDTVAGDAAAGRAHGLGACGLWLRVRVFGLGVLRFNTSEGQRGTVNAQ